MGSATQLNKEQLHQVELECNRTLSHAHDVVTRFWPQAGAYCAGVWDGLTCWPPTLAGHTAAQPCHRYFEGHYNLVGCQGNSATRYCTSAGEWFVHPQTRTAWTNYTECIGKPLDDEDLYTSTTENSVAVAAALSAAAAIGGDIVTPDDLSNTYYSATGRTARSGGGDALWHEMRTNYLSHIQAISIMSSIGYMTSLVLLCIALGILIIVRRLKSPRNKLLINLSASFMLRATVIILIRYLPLERWASENDLNNMFYIRTELVTGDRSNTTLNEVTFSVMYPNACLAADRTERHPSPLWTMCKFGELVKHYSLLANYFWILMEGFYLNNILTFALFSEHSWLYAYICGGWLPPAVFVGIWATLKSAYAASNDECWHTEVYNDSHFWIIRGPITAAIFLSFIVFVNILRIVCTKLAGTREIDQSLQTPIKRRYAKLAKSFLCLIPLCGTHYVLTLTLADIKNPRTQVVWLFIEQLFTSFQGAFVALIYIFMSGDVRREIHRALTRRRSSKFKSVGRSGGNAGAQAKGPSGANGRGPRKRSNPHLNHHNANHQPLRVMSSSPVIINGHAVVNFLQRQQQPTPRLSPGQQPCADCVAFKMKPITSKIHRFHPLLNKKSLTMSTFVPFNGGVGGTGNSPTSPAVVAVQREMLFNVNPMDGGCPPHISNGATNTLCEAFGVHAHTVHSNGSAGRHETHSLTVVANNQAQCEFASVAPSSAASPLLSPAVISGSQHEHSNGVIGRKLKKYKQLRSRSSLSHEQKSTSNGSSNNSNQSGISSDGSKTLRDSTSPITSKIGSEATSDASRRSCRSPTSSKSIVVEKTSSHEFDLADSSLLSTTKPVNKMSLLKLPKNRYPLNHDGSDVDGGGTTDNTDDEIQDDEDEADEEKTIGERLMQNRHLYD